MIAAETLYPAPTINDAGEEMPEQPRVYTPEQVAEILQIHPRTVARMLERGEIRGIRAGRLWRVPAENLEAYLKGQRDQDKS